MFNFDNLSDRHMVPRWHPVQHSLLSSESKDQFQFKSDPTFQSDFFVTTANESLRKQLGELESTWVENPTIENATEFVLGAHACPVTNWNSAQEAAKFVRRNISNNSSLVPILDKIQGHNVGFQVSGFADYASEIRKRKKALRENPKNPLLFADTARLYANLGQDDKCRALLERARILSPNSRYILRAFSRFLVHSGDLDRAFSLLNRSDRTDHDPWLKSAELAVSSTMGKMPRQWRKAKQILNKHKSTPHLISELAAEMGTIELEAGQRRVGVGLMKLGAEMPTENSAAQVEFIGRNTNFFDPETLLPKSIKSSEAEAHSHYWKGNWSEALEAVTAWKMIEPFSSRPVVFGTYLAAIDLNLVNDGLALFDLASRDHVSDRALENNHIVLLALSDNLGQARKKFEELPAPVTRREKIFDLAAEGLLNLREGRYLNGFEKYQLAINAAADAKMPTAALTAYCFYAREVAVLGEAVKSSVLGNIKRLKHAIEKKQHAIPPDINRLIENVGDTKVELDLLPKFDNPALVVPDF